MRLDVISESRRHRRADTPPPPCSAWSPSPAPFHSAGADKRHRPRDATRARVLPTPEHDPSPRVIFVRLLRRWGRFGHDQRSARRKKLPLPGGERVGVRGFERLGKELQRLLPLTRSLSLATSPRRGEVKKQTKRKRNAERRRVQPPHLAVRRCSCGSSTPLGVPPRFLPKGLFIPKAQLRPGFVDGGTKKRRVAPPAPRPLPAMHLACRS